MESNWEKAIEFVLAREGGYVNHSDDPGGETNFGISKKAYPNFDIKNLTKDRAKDIYHKDYWLKAGCDKLANPLDIIVFDTAVNCGVSRANSWLITHDWKDYLFMRLQHYANLGIARSFMVGWTRRVIELWRLAGGL